MDQNREKKIKKCSIRRRKNFKETTRGNKNREAKKIIKKAKTSPLTSLDLSKILKKHPNFLGIFASDQIPVLCLTKYPICFIVNIDISSLKGSHWIAIYIDNSRVEIFDSLGFNPNLWTFYPKKLFHFLKSFSFTHRFLISDIYQPPNTFYCGLFCVFFILLRSSRSFRKITGNFSRNLKKNILILENFLLNYFN